MNVKTPLGLFRIVREPLNAGGYTRRGEYFGRGSKLYLVVTDDGQYHLRAPSAHALARWCRDLTSDILLQQANYHGINF